MLCRVMSVRQTVKIHQDDGLTFVRYFNLEEGAVVIEPDLREHFPDAAALSGAVDAQET
jgi:hypothetical protein